MDIERARINIENAIDSNSYFLFKNIFPDTPKWDNFINHLNFEFHNPPSENQHSDQEVMINGVSKRNHFYLSVRNPTIEFYPKLKEVIDFFNIVMEEGSGGVSSFINFVGNENPVGSHPDRRDTVYWQCIGNSEWVVGEKQENIILSPGDVIFVPKGVFHHVITKEPRAAIALAYKQMV